LQQTPLGWEALAMNKILLMIGGAVDLLFVVFQIALVKPMDVALTGASPDVRSIVASLNVQLAFALLIFGGLAIFQWRSLLTTRLGRIVAIGIAAFWFLRGLNQALFFGLSAYDLPIIGLCLIFGLLHLIPALRTSELALGEPQPRPAKRTAASRRWPNHASRTPWASYAAVAWCVLFGALHLYWALGGNAGLADLSMPSNRTAALARDPGYIGITWAVVLACVVAALLALAHFQPVLRRLPRWMLVFPLWFICCLFLLRGLGTLIQSALIVGGAMPFAELTGPDGQAWSRYLLIDAAVYAPWFTLGGIAFGLTARSAASAG
jgi:hypothetical protein